MKRKIMLLLAMSLVISLTGCGSNSILNRAVGKIEDDLNDHITVDSAYYNEEDGIVVVFFDCEDYSNDDAQVYLDGDQIYYKHKYESINSDDYNALITSGYDPVIAYNCYMGEPGDQWEQLK